MLGLKLNHVSKSGHRQQTITRSDVDSGLCRHAASLWQQWVKARSHIYLGNVAVNKGGWNVNFQILFCSSTYSCFAKQKWNLCLKNCLQKLRIYIYIYLANMKTKFGSLMKQYPTYTKILSVKLNLKMKSYVYLCLYKYVCFFFLFRFECEPSVIVWKLIQYIKRTGEKYV